MPPYNNRVERNIQHIMANTMMFNTRPARASNSPPRRSRCILRSVATPSGLALAIRNALTAATIPTPHTGDNTMLAYPSQTTFVWDFISLEMGPMPR